MDELKEKHSKGTNELDDADRAPTGLPYQQERAEELRRKKEMKELQDQQARMRLKEEAAAVKNKKNNLDEESDDDSIDSSDDEFLNELENENDPELEAIRNRRMMEMRQAQIERAENISKGHGQYRWITQDEFLKECVGSKYVCVHFFHNEFERCKIMDHHLNMIAPAHLSCKFVKIDAEKAPFFVDKLKVSTLPTLIVFLEGKAIDRLTGFQGLKIDHEKNPDKWPTGKLQEWLANTGAIEYKPPSHEVKEEMKRLGYLKGSVYSSTLNNYHEEY